MFFWSRDRTENRFAPCGRSTLFLVGAPEHPRLAGCNKFPSQRRSYFSGRATGRKTVSRPVGAPHFSWSTLLSTLALQGVIDFLHSVGHVFLVARPDGKPFRALWALHTFPGRRS